MPENVRICCHDYDLITLQEESTQIHSTDLETDIQWFFL